MPAEDPAPLEFSNSDLTARIRAGDIRAFEQVYKAYHLPLVQFANSYYNNIDSAREAVQVTFVRIWEQRESLEIRESIRGYLFRAVRNACMDDLRRRTREEGNLASVARDQESCNLPPQSPAELLDAEERRAAVWRAINSLPERRRLVMTLRWQHGLTNPEVAEVLGISVKGVEGHVARALEHLAQELDEYSA